MDGGLRIRFLSSLSQEARKDVKFELVTMGPK